MGDYDHELEEALLRDMWEREQEHYRQFQQWEYEDALQQELEERTVTIKDIIELPDDQVVEHIGATVVAWTLERGVVPQKVLVPRALEGRMQVLRHPRIQSMHSKLWLDGTIALEFYE